MKTCAPLSKIKELENRYKNSRTSSQTVKIDSKADLTAKTSTHNRISGFPLKIGAHCGIWPYVPWCALSVESRSYLRGFTKKIQIGSITDAIHCFTRWSLIEAIIDCFNRPIDVVYCWDLTFLLVWEDESLFWMHPLAFWFILIHLWMSTQRTPAKRYLRASLIKGLSDRTLILSSLA